MARRATSEFLAAPPTVSNELARRAFERLAGALAAAVKAASPRTLEMILGTDDPRAMLTLAQRDLAPMPTARVAAIRRAQLAGVGMREALLGRLDGGVASRGEAAAILNIKPTALDRRRERGRILALAMGREHVFPRDQFDGGDIVSGLPEILTALRGATGWAMLDFLTTPLEGFGGQTPLVLLKTAGGDDETVERLRRRAAAERLTGHAG